jgi:hypothetical protein
MPIAPTVGDMAKTALIEARKLRTPDWGLRRFFCGAHRQTVVDGASEVKLRCRAMAIRFQCGACSQPIEVDDEWAGKAVACPYCHKTVTAPVESTLADPSTIPTAKPLIADATDPQAPAGALFQPEVVAHHPNRVAVAALILASILVVLMVAFMIVAGAHSLELLKLQEEMQEGAGDRSPFEVMQGFLDDYGGTPPTWIIVLAMLEFASGAVCIAALICGILGLRRPHHRPFAIVALVIAGGVMLMFCGSLVFSLL